jgi:hypothetical protein
LVFSLDHPFRDCFLDEEEDEVTLYATRSYFDNRPMRWHWDTRDGILMQSHHHTVAQWIDMLHGAGFRLQRLIEPIPPTAMLDEIWPMDDALAAMRHIPPTIIFAAETA